ncbi:MAG: hypothetical protein ABH879_02015 [archaeon]
MIQYLLALLAAHAGLYFGMALALISPEEIGPGRKHFVRVQHVLLLIMLALLFYSSGPVVAVPLAVLTAILFRHQEAAYALLSLIFLAMYDSGFAVHSGFLIFLYGLPAGTLASENKHAWQAFSYLARHYLWFILLGIVLYLPRAAFLP